MTWENLSVPIPYLKKIRKLDKLVYLVYIHFIRFILRYVYI